MRKKVYIETSIISYITANPSRDLIKMARQELTRDWWYNRARKYDLFTSEVVFQESGEGDKEAATKRLALIEPLSHLDITAIAESLANKLIKKRVLPRIAAADAFHLALATVHKMDILLTWNCRHLANADTMSTIMDKIKEWGFSPPLICTPELLMGEN